ncbi:gliding motility-associated C-terminal domain-containing protein [Pontimicrobium sp. MEBiC06410]
MIPIKTTQNYRQTSVKLLVVLVMLLTCSDIVAQVKTSFTPRYNETVNGDVTIIANNMLSRSATGNYTGSDGNHDFTDNVYVDIDSDNSTFNSSNANFVNPEPTLSCLTIKKVLLYWAAADKEPNSNLNSENQANWNYNDVKLMLPGQTLYSTLTADDVIFRGRDETSHFSNDPYICVKDITTAVTNLTNPYGTYQVANVEAKTGSVEAHPSGNTGTSGGWQIVFVYESPMMPAKNIALFDGYAHVTSSENDFDIDFNGFQTVPTGNVNAKIVIGALEGDRDLSGDKLQIQNTSGNFVDISSSQRSSTNFFNSRITVDGANYTNRIPASTNTLGFDAATFHLSNPSNSIIDNDQTSATIRLTSNQETYGLFLVGLAVDVWLPDLAPITLVPTPPSTIAQDPGSTMSFGFDIENNGNDNAINVQVTSTIAPEVDLVEPITGLPTGITYTYNSSTKILTFFIANGLADVGDPLLSVNYQIIVKDECYFLEGSCSSSFSSQFTATYNGVLNPNLQTTVTSSSVDNCGIGDELPTIMQINQPNEATWLTALGSLDRTVECNDLTGLADAQSLAPIASCPNLIPIKTVGSFITDPSCNDNGSYTNTWNFTDACGRTIVNFVQVITIQDSTPPTFTAPADIEIFTDASCNYDAGVNITGDVTDEADNCSATLDATYTDTVVAGTCEGSFIITRTWTLTDSCGNTAPEQTQTITVSDNIAPTFTAPADIEIECDQDPNDLTITGDVTDENDNCSTTLDATYTDTTASGSCANESVITRTWTLADDCGNTTTLIQTITISDNTAPTFTVPTDIEIECDQDASDLTLTGDVTDETDNCSTNLDATYTDTTQAGDCPNESIITRTWTLSDDCGNNTELVQTITVSDNTAPTLTTDLEPIISVTCSEIPEIPSLEFIDACSGTDITISFEETSTYTGDGNDYEITWEWTVTDSCDNTEVYTQIVQVNNETFTTELDDERCNEDGAIDLFNYLSDDIDTSGTWEVVSGDAIIDNGIFEPLDVELGDYVFSYTITDGACLTSTIVTITINDDCVVLPCGSEDFEISKAITPNGDAYNEYFEVKGTRDCGFTVELKLFNRWGAIIYESNDYQNDWNGFTHKSSLGNSNKVPNGTYYYVVTIKDSGIKPFAGPIYVGTK